MLSFCAAGAAAGAGWAAACKGQGNSARSKRKVSLSIGFSVPTGCAVPRSPLIVRWNHLATSCSFSDHHQEYCVASADMAMAMAAVTSEKPMSLTSLAWPLALRPGGAETRGSVPPGRMLQWAIRLSCLRSADFLVVQRSSFHARTLTQASPASPPQTLNPQPQPFFAAGSWALLNPKPSTLNPEP